MWRRILTVAIPAVLLAGPDDSQQSISFSRDIAPIIRQNCSNCHRPGESGPFPLLTYQDVKRHAAQIAAVTKSRYMPPWLPEGDHGELPRGAAPDKPSNRIDRGMGETREPRLARATSERSQRRHCAMAARPPRPGAQRHRAISLTAGGPEVFWNFIIPVPITDTRWVRAVEIHPGSPRAVHHASIILDRSRSARRQPNVQKSGFPGMDLTIEETTFDPDGTFLAWKPGNVPAPEPEGMAWRADPGMDLIFNVHLRPSGKPETVMPVIGLYFTDKPPNKFPMLLELENDS